MGIAKIASCGISFPSSVRILVLSNFFHFLRGIVGDFSTCEQRGYPLSGFRTKYTEWVSLRGYNLQFSLCP